MAYSAIQGKINTTEFRRYNQYSMDAVKWFESYEISSHKFDTCCKPFYDALSTGQFSDVCPVTPMRCPRGHTAPLSLSGAQTVILSLHHVNISLIRFPLHGRKLKRPLCRQCSTGAVRVGYAAAFKLSRKLLTPVVSASTRHQQFIFSILFFPA